MIPDAASLLAAMDEARPVAPVERERLLDLEDAQRLQSEVNRLRLQRGDRPVGFKIGFTNRSLWPIYGVFHPIWAPVWAANCVQSASTDADGVVEIDLNRVGLPLTRFSEPRFEPEIVVGLRAAPASPSLADVAAAIDWVAHGIEIVQSVWPGWRFTAAESFAAQGLHGALLVGPRRRVLAPNRLAEGLSRIRLSLSRDGVPVADGEGTAVLDGPVQALAHLVTMLASQPALPAPLALQAGSIITTGTLTDAQALAPGQCWRTRLDTTAARLGNPPALDGPLADLRLTT